MSPVTRRELVGIAGPAALAALLSNAFRLIDQYAAGSIGKNAQGAIASCLFVLIAISGILLVISSGAGPLIGRATGSGDLALRRKAFGNALSGALVVGIGVGVLGYVGAPVVAGLLGLEGAMADDAIAFLRWLLGTGLAGAIFPVVDATLVALGRTGTMMGLEAFAAALNFVLNPFFIHTLGMGVGGAALATNVGRTVAVSIGLAALYRELQPSLRDLLWDGTLWRMVRVGMPTALTVVLYALVYWALLHFTISPLGINAALGIGFAALEGVTYPLFLGMSQGVYSLAARRIGAGQPEEAMRAARLAFPLTTALGLACALTFRFAAEPICGVFSRDPEVLREAVLYAHILGWSQVFVAWEALAEGVLAGAGDTRSLFWWSVPINVARVPLAWFLAMHLGWGPSGVWWAINLTSFAKAAGKGLTVLRGRWKDVVV